MSNMGTATQHSDLIHGYQPAEAEAEAVTVALSGRSG